MVSTLIGVGALLAITVVVLSIARLRFRRTAVVAIVRGTLQLAALSLVLSGLIEHPAGVALALVVMFTVAVLTSTRRIGSGARGYWIVGSSIAIGVCTTLTIVFLSGAIEFSPRYVLAIGGIVIGGAMTISTLAGRRLTQALHERWGEVEAWLALGATPRRATVDLARKAATEALIPTTDQTRTTGLVTLPGAFVGAIFGGVAPLEAGQFQIVVLAALLATGTLTATLLTRQLSPTLPLR